MAAVDDFDRASLQEQQVLERELAAQRVNAIHAPKVRPRGYCQNPRCGEDFPAGDPRLFCNSGCAK